MGWLSFLATTGWLVLYVVASFTIIFVLRAKSLNLNYKYGIISTIGLLAFCIIVIRLQTKPYNRTRLFNLNSYYSRMSKNHAVILQRMDYRSVYQDYAGMEVDVKEILERKRFLNVFESPPNFELMDVVVEVLERKGTPYLYVNFNILPSLEYKYKDKEEFWGLVAQSIISNFQKLTHKPLKEIVLLFDNLNKFYGTSNDLEQMQKWEYFAEIVETLYKRLEFINIVIITENPEVSDYLEGKAG